jgi:hypothetical protein
MVGIEWYQNCYNHNETSFYKKYLLNTTQLAGWRKTGSPKAMKHDIRWA